MNYLFYFIHTTTNASEDTLCSSSHRSNIPKHTLGKIQNPNYNAVSTNQINLDVEALKKLWSLLYQGNIIDKQGGFDVNTKELNEKSRATFLQSRDI